jgi:hypothetical protein
MKNIILILTVSIVFGQCTSEQIEVKKSKEKDVLTTYLYKLDSAGIDTNNNRLLFEIGYQTIYYGQNNTGNTLVEYSFTKMVRIVANDYRHWSVQNTKNGNYIKAIVLLEKAME